MFVVPWNIFLFVSPKAMINFFRKFRFRSFRFLVKFTRKNHEKKESFELKNSTKSFYKIIKKQKVKKNEQTHKKQSFKNA